MRIKFAEKVTTELVKSQKIKLEDQELYRYGIEQGILILLNVLTALAIGLIFHCLFYVVIFSVAFVPLRSYAGGFHAKTKVRCFLSSTVTIIVSMVCIQQIRWTETENILITVISAVVIWIMAPVENGNKRLDSVEYRVYRQRTRKILLLEVLLFVLSLTFGWEDLVIVITMVFSIVCVVLVTGKVKMLKDRRRTVC